MKKTTLLLCLILSIALTAQTTVWEDNFDDEDVTDWTLLDEDGDGNFWADQFVINDDDGNPVTPVSMISRSWAGNPLTPDNWAVSPAIDLSNASGVIELSYLTQVAAESWDEEVLSVHVGTSNDITVLVNSAISTTETLGDVDNTGIPTNHTLDISALAGESQVFIAFRHWDCTDQDFISLDDVTVSAETLGVDEFSINSVKHYFNYDTKVLTLNSQVVLKDVVLYNVLGQESYRSAINSNISEHALSGLQSGIYIAKINSQDNKSKTIKLVVK